LGKGITEMKKALTLAVAGCVGFVAGYAVCEFLRKPSGEYPSIESNDFLSTRYDFGETARSRASVAGVRVPDDARDVFYAIGGLKPVVELVAFTVRNREPSGYIDELAGGTAEKRSLARFLGTGWFGGSEYQTIMFAPSNLDSQTAVGWTIREGVHAVACADAAQRRIFIEIVGD